MKMEVMSKKSTTSTIFLSLWRWHSNSALLFAAAVLVIVVMSTAKRPDWMQGSWRLERHEETASCDVSSGRWVYDNVTHPLYSGLNCVYMNDEIACDKYGRNDTRYQQWRWQPNGCNLPRFDAREMLEKLRGKRMVYVGDSLNRNQWMSMVCMLAASIPSEHTSFVTDGSLMSFRAEEYNVSVDFYWSPVLVESNCDDPVNHRISDRIMRAGAIEKHAKHWTDADILIFNSYLWWKKPGLKMKVMYGSFEDEEKHIQEVEMIEGFQLALKTWSDWIESHLDRMKAKVFFMSLSPTHIWGEEWGGDQNCFNETEPITKQGYTGGGSDHTFTCLVERAINGLMKKGVGARLLNITQLSEYRKDGHPSIYRKHWDAFGEEQLANPSSYSDCIHWCLPGVPDAWNEILYAYIMSK